VFAEDTGTNNIVSALPMPIMVRSSCGSNCNPPFTIKVPTIVPGLPGANRTFDLFATTIDLYQGVTDPFQGHTIAVFPDVTGPSTPLTSGACTPVPAPASSDTITCTGHGSITGVVGVANLGTSVVLSKVSGSDLVKITNTAVQNQLPNDNPTNSYSFCVPGGDTYAVQVQQLPDPPIPPSPTIVFTPTPTATPAPSPTPTPPLVAPTPVLIGAPVDVIVPQAPVIATPSATSGSPTATPTPTIKCPTTCSITGNSCPGICTNVVVPQL
jgi:hypothetical protein